MYPRHGCGPLREKSGVPSYRVLGARFRVPASRRTVPVPFPSGDSHPVTDDLGTQASSPVLLIIVGEPDPGTDAPTYSGTLRRLACRPPYDSRCPLWP